MWRNKSEQVPVPLESAILPEIATFDYRSENCAPNEKIEKKVLINFVFEDNENIYFLAVCCKNRLPTKFKALNIIGNLNFPNRVKNKHINPRSLTSIDDLKQVFNFLNLDESF